MRLALAAALLASPAFADDVERYAVMTAFAPEWAVMQSRIDAPEVHEANGIVFVTGTLAGKPVVAFRSGVSMVNAAMTTQMAIDRFNVKGIVFSGIAGGVDPTLSVGDVVVAAEWSQYLEAVMARETADGFAIPPWMQPTDVAPFGMIHPQPVDIAQGEADPEPRLWFPADPDYLKLAAEVAETVTLENCAGGTCLSHTPRIVTGGNGVSGAAFVDNAELREWIHATFAAQVVDMESAAVAHVAYANDVPFIAFRSLSDLAGGSEAANEMATFMALASENSARVVEAFVARLD